jgi:hypothetical protein
LIARAEVRYEESRVAELVAVCGWEERTARRVAVGYGVGDLNCPEPASLVGGGAVECTDPGGGRAVRGRGGLPAGSPYVSALQRQDLDGQASTTFDQS